MKTFIFFGVSAMILLLGYTVGLAQSTNSLSDADTAWKGLLQGTNWPPPPKGWKTHKPTEDQLRQYCQENIDSATAAAEHAKAFYTQFPDSTNAATAKTLESKMLRRAYVYDRILHRLNATVGKSLDIKFTAVDGRRVDLSSMKGKVVLVEFWATWCPGCVAEIPDVKLTYDKFHSKGLDVIAISFDTDVKALKNFVQAHDIPWPQYFDGKGWG
ncbi:MAG: peroxiredoxin family protein, partial [Limisphaerales bacterium]